jgi:predicted Ser/Thr protein kinase
LSVRPGQILAHYRLIEQIGEGGMGVVYRAHDARLERDVALKVLSPGIVADEEARKRFRKEALTLSKLNHPAIATAFDFNTREGVDFLVMELVTGETLKQKLSKGPLPEKEVLRLGLQLAEGLAAAHEHDILHRDLKPGNLRITADGRLKILDFGLAKLVRPAGDIGTTATVTQTRGVVGTVPYMSPEQLRGEAIDGRSDIYAAGAVLYELSTGRRPFPETQGPLLINGILNQAPEAPSGVNPQVSAELESIILKALDKDPERRYQSARELQVDLGRLGDSAVTIAPVRRARAGRWRLPLVSAVVVLIAVAAALYLSTGRTEAMNTLAVMPFVNVSSDAEAEYLCRLQGARRRSPGGGTRAGSEGADHGAGGASGRRAVDQRRSRADPRRPPHLGQAVSAEVYGDLLGTAGARRPDFGEPASGIDR